MSNNHQLPRTGSIAKHVKPRFFESKKYIPDPEECLCGEKPLADNSMLKCYVLTVSKHFPANHPRKGDRTKFVYSFTMNKKIHTIRLNYELWKKRIDEVNEGKAYISLRYWQGKPYKSKQIEFWQLSKGEVGIQKIELHQWVSFDKNQVPVLQTIHSQIDGRHPKVDLNTIAKNDGLTKADFKAWFFPKLKNDVFIAGAIIHFTDFRY